MPKDTFYNLSKEKKAQIYKIAIEEFADYSYEKVSITRIVEKAGIAKGSFYQYFENKKDLFMYIIDEIGKAKMESMTSLIENIDKMDFFEFLRQLFRKGIEFGKSKPELAKVLDRIMNEMPKEIKAEIYKEGEVKSLEMFENLLKAAIEKRQIRSDIDVRLVSYMITHLSMSVSEYHFQDMPVKEENFDKIIDTSDSMVEILERGLGFNVFK
ncbi:AcrR family transcriptional regulator [Acetoanaerobium pronyense]|uniref:AcrR family transcriptional regulator n=1 Tax=Acetoanaerobium pronyense TaxID=1482736 RepID=A0ABS4KGE6_9FIRM|nr:TetR/AcrR family transcriptional regulator [Acetoanaerobium pronyense]MBP2026860.1 AcrR family transcriptional regulator [Acetoanaerobium pronyense]